MSEEEKKAIEDLKRLRKGIEILNQITSEKDEIDIKAIDLILNLIEKQQKEIQRLEKDNDTLSELVIVNEDKVIKELDLISKDKIREKIKAFQDVKKEIIKNENKLSRASITYDIVRNDYCEKMLQELLEE